MMEDNNESSRRNFVRQLEKYTLAEKRKLGECVEMLKRESIRCHTQKVRTTGYWEFMLHIHRAHIHKSLKLSLNSTVLRK